jgi:plastocyanin
MKKLYILLALFSMVYTVNGAKHIITNSGLQFSPADITVNVGDTIVFQLESLHNAVEVSQSTYDANGTQSNGGFSVAFGGGQVIVNTPGILYYVCTTHASSSMKGIIRVMNANSILNFKQESIQVSRIFPNPSFGSIYIALTVPNETLVTIEMINTIGQTTDKLLDKQPVAGSRQFNFSFKGKYPAGLYFIKTTWNEGYDIQKLMIR